MSRGFTSSLCIWIVRSSLILYIVAFFLGVLFPALRGCSADVGETCLATLLRLYLAALRSRAV